MRELERIQLEQMTFAARQYIDDYRGDIDLQVIQDTFNFGLIAQFKAQVWTHKLPPLTQTATDYIDVEIWDSAWQLWKHNHANSKFLGWIARRWPPQKRGSETYQAKLTFNLDRKVVFPEAEYPAQLGTPYMQVVRNNDPVEWLR